MLSGYVLLYSEEVQKAKFYIEESFRLTKKKVWRIIFLMFPVLIVIGIMVTIVQIGEERFMENRVYQALTAIQKQSGQDDHKLLEGFFTGNNDDREAFGKIEKAYSPKTDSIDRAFLRSSLDYIDTASIDPEEWIFTILFVIFSFLVFEGLTSMIYLSVYRILLAEDSKNSWTSSEK